MKELNLKSVDVVKLALVMGVLGLIVSFMGLSIFLAVGSAVLLPQGWSFLPGTTFLLFIGGPILYFILSFVIALIFGIFFNLSISITGGLPLRFKE